jgi:hypothetical protein
VNLFQNFTNEDLFSIGGVSKLIGNMLVIAYWFVGVLSVIFLIVGGIMYATSFGQPDRLRTAKNAITWSVAGLLIAMSAYAIVTLVFNGFK